MQHMYKTEKEAIQSLVNGVEFKNIRFDYFRDNENVVLKACIYQGAESLKTACKKLRDDKVFMKKILSIKPEALEFCSNNLKDNWELVLLACEKNPAVICYASKELIEKCKNKDPIKVIQSLILERNLNSNLTVNKEKHIKKTKI